MLLWITVKNMQSYETDFLPLILALYGFFKKNSIVLICEPIFQGPV